MQRVFSVTDVIVPPVEIEFADGRHTIPGVFVSELGGADELNKQAAALKEVTYADFMRAFSDERAGRFMQAQVQQLINQQFRKFVR